MEISRQMIDGVLVLRLDFERLDTKMAPDLKAEFLQALGENYINILVNFEKVKYADSSGLGALLLGTRQTREHGGQFKICCSNGRILQLIEIAKLEKHIINYESEKEALKSFSESN